MTRVVLTSAAKEDIRDLDGSARALVLKALTKLGTEPEKRGAPLGSPSTSNLTSFRKLVVGDRQYRVVYRVENDGSVCVVWVIASRVDRECYDLAKSRLKLYTTDSALARELTRLLDAAWEGVG